MPYLPVAETRNSASTSRKETKTRTSSSSCSSVTTDSWLDVPAVAQYYAIWGAAVVYTSRYANMPGLFFLLALIRGFL